MPRDSQSSQPWVLLLGATIVAVGVQGSGAHETIPATGSIQTTIARPRTAVAVPAVFVPNAGQLDPQVRYSSRGAHHAVFATDTGMTLVFEEGSDRRFALRLGFVGAARSHVEAASPDGARVNYFLGRDERRWRTNLPTYHDVRYRNLWPGIDASFVVESDRMKYQFEIAPGADPSRIRLRYDGAARLSLGHGGALRIEAGDRVLTDAAPVGFQTIAGQVRPVRASYAIGRNGEYGITIGEYDRSQPLTIDPTIVYASFLGGSGAESANGVAVDAAGNAYVAGTTGSIDFPVTPDAYQSTLGDVGDPEYNRRLDAFVAKVSADGSRLMYATYLGGTNEDDGNAIAVDADGNAYVAGTTRATDFPTTPDAFQSVAPGGGVAAFITKLDPTGSRLVYSTYYGPGANGQGLAIDRKGRAYLVGSTFRRDLPGMESGFGGPPPPSSSRDHGFLVRLSATGRAVEYGTYISGSADDYPRAVAVIGTRAFVAGSTSSYDFPTTEGAFDPVGPRRCSERQTAP